MQHKKKNVKLIEIAKDNESKQELIKTELLEYTRRKLTSSPLVKTASAENLCLLILTWHALQVSKSSLFMQLFYVLE